MPTRNTSARKSNANRLVGWLVSYQSDEMGTAHEIRSGRTLIGADSSGGDRAIKIKDTTVSSPHSALHASRAHEILVQDVFSDAGTYVCRSDSQHEQSVSGPIELQHGDWLRIGDSIRFQLCLIEGTR